MNLPDLTKQLDLIFQLAPGPHEIRILHRYYTIQLDETNHERILMKANGKDYQNFALGTPQNTQETITLIQKHFTDYEPHNCFIISNRVADKFQLKLVEYNKIGYAKKLVAFSPLTEENDIQAICTLPIDLDRSNEEVKKLAANETELQELNAARIELVQELSTYNLTPTWQICSGNGYQPIYLFEPQIREDAFKKAKEAIRTILEGLHNKYIGKADIDTKLKDPNRLVRLAGITNKKPDRIVDESQGRIYRLATLIEAQGTLNRFENILALAESMKHWQKNDLPTPAAQISVPMSMPQKEIVPPSSLPPSFSFDVRAYLSNHAVSIKQEKTWKVCTMLVLEKCTFDPNHTDGEASVLIHPDGRLSYQCFHNSCKDKTWSNLREKLEGPRLTTCKYCGTSIHWENKKPFNQDGSPHQCLKPVPETQENGNSETIQINGFQSWDEFRNAKEGLRTGFTELDSLITIPPAALTVVGGRPGHGKTTFLLNLCLKLIHLYPDLMFPIFSYEEMASEIALKFLIIKSKVALNLHQNINEVRNYLRQGCTDNTKLETEKTEILNLIQNNRLRIFGESLPIDQLATTLEKLAKTYPIGAVLIDYIQKIPPCEKSGTRQLELQRISHCLLETAKSLSLPLILGAQLGRDKDRAEKVRLDNFREAGDIEQDANLALGIWNPSVEKQSENQGAFKSNSENTIELETEIELTILKNRNGVANQTIKLSFNKPTLQMSDVQIEQKHSWARRS
jgi:replicative DNA helicase